MEPKIQQFLFNMPEDKSRLAMEVRDIILSVQPSIVESIKWNQLTFCLNKINIAFIYTYSQTDYINLGFFNAVQLSDPGHLFEGTGKGMRHIKIRSSNDIDALQIQNWVGEAILLNGFTSSKM